MDDAAFESRVLRFERARKLHGPQEIADHLEGLADPDRSRLLLELLCIDLEYSWRTPCLDTPTILEAYVRRFPS